MDRPDYAYGFFEPITIGSPFPARGGVLSPWNWVPGIPFSRAMVSWSLNASRTHLVDLGRFARDDLAGCRRMADFLSRKNLPAPPVAGAGSVAELLERMNAHYGVDGVASLRAIADSSVDFIWSQAVLEHVYREEFADILDELRRIVRPDGVCSHRIDLKDHLGGGLNNLRFSSSLWETEWIRRSGFYTNRIRFPEMLRLFEQAGFMVCVIRADRWPALPLPLAEAVRRICGNPHRRSAGLGIRRGPDPPMTAASRAV